MPMSKIETCEIKLAKVNENISKFIHENNIDEIKTNRNIITYYNKLNDSDKKSYLLSKNVTLDACKSADKLYMKLNRLKKRKEKPNKSYVLSNQYITHRQHLCHHQM